MCSVYSYRKCWYAAVVDSELSLFADHVSGGDESWQLVIAHRAAADNGNSEPLDVNAMAGL